MVVNKVYDVPDAEDIGRSHHFCLEVVPDDSRIIEFGPATGYITRIYRDSKRCRVTGVEYSPEAAEMAAPYCEQMFVGDIEDPSLWTQFTPPYDAVVFTDVLEHLRNPTVVLAKCRTLLKSDGIAAISVPNIAHISIRINLLRGRFDYAQYGIMDNTHLKFFTEKTFRAMIDEAGFTVEQFDFSHTVFPLDAKFERLKLGWLKKKINGAMIHFFPNASGFQLLAFCRPKNNPNRPNASSENPLTGP